MCRFFINLREYNPPLLQFLRSSFELRFKLFTMFTPRGVEHRQHQVLRLRHLREVILEDKNIILRILTNFLLCNILAFIQCILFLLFCLPWFLIDVVFRDCNNKVFMTDSQMYPLGLRLFKNTWAIHNFLFEN